MQNNWFHLSPILVVVSGNPDVLKISQRQFPPQETLQPVWSKVSYQNTRLSLLDTLYFPMLQNKYNLAKVIIYH